LRIASSAIYGFKRHAPRSNIAAETTSPGANAIFSALSPIASKTWIRAFKLIQTPKEIASMRLHHLLSSVVVACVLSACASAPPPKPAPQPNVHLLQNAVANIAPASGTLVSGRLKIAAMADGVRITGELGGLGRNATHAIHVHERGDCSAADGSSAGAHFNPSAAPHGRAGHGAHHAGDMDNLVADGNGVARVDIHLRGVILGGGAANDILGRAIIVHANPDDYTTQPTGNAGGRIGCGVIDAPRY
jgi:superoxide dismutase, Cu-Zn family